MTWLTDPAHHRWLESETDRLLDFARGARRDLGGFGWLDARGRISADRPVELLVTSRMTHVFALGHLLGRPGCGPMVDHGLAALGGIFLDAEHGGWFTEVAAAGPVSPEKTAYGHAFVALAASSAVCAGRPGAQELLDAVLGVIERRFWDEAAGACRESWDAAFTTTEPYRGANSNMHSVEAYLSVHGATGERVWLDRALRIAERIVHGVARHNDWRIIEHFDDGWNPVPEHNADNPADRFRPYGATLGHSLEWSRLLVHLDAALGAASPAWVMADARALFAAAVAEGWAVDGADGFVYTVDWSGRPVVRLRMHWVLAEAIAAAAALHRATGDRRYADWYATWWDYAAEHLLDRRHGSWFHELDPANRPSETVWPGKGDVYHALQCTLVPRLPLSPMLAPAMAAGLLDSPSAARG